MSWFANVVYFVGAIAYAPVLAYQMIALKKNRRGWRERLLGPRLVRTRASGRRCIWLHAVSLGEVNAARQVVCGLEQQIPDLDVVVSTTTDTGFARAVELFGRDRVFRFPLDFSWAVEAALRRLQPDLIVLVELEVWFNLMQLAARRKVPVVVVNGRLTERSCRRFALLGLLGRTMFRRLSWVGAQDETIAARFQSVGVPAERVSVTGSVKWDAAQVAESIPGAEALAAALGIDSTRPVWVCGSTGPGEEEMILRAYARLRAAAPDVQLAIIPRKPERFDQVEEIIRRAGFECIRRSRRPDGTSLTASLPTSDRSTVILGDTMGELRKFYALASVVFVGRSLVPMGGSDPMEVAALGRPILVGPHMDNFELPTHILREGGALIQVDDADQLRANAAALLADRTRAARMGALGRDLVRQQQGATQRTLDALARIIDNAAESEKVRK